MFNVIKVSYTTTCDHISKVTLKSATRKITVLCYYLTNEIKKGNLKETTQNGKHYFFLSINGLAFWCGYKKDILVKLPPELMFMAPLLFVG